MVNPNGLPRNKVTILLIVTALVVALFSSYIHSPDTPALFGNWGLKYNDIVYGVFNPRFSPDNDDLNRYWYKAEALNSILNGDPACPVPYIDYMFEYPPLIGLLWYLSTCASVKMASWSLGSESFDLKIFMERVAGMHYILNVIPLSCSLLFIVLILASVKSAQEAFLWLMLPSTILYSMYNWDLICAALALFSLLMFRKQKYLTSGILLGLSVATKLMTLLMAYTIFIYLFLKVKRRRYLIAFTLGFLSFGIIPYAIVFLLAPRGFADFLAHHSSWYCENCLYLVLIHDILSSLHKALTLLAFLSLIAVITVIIYRYKNRFDDEWFYKLLLCSIAGTIVLNYVFSPQMILLFSPMVFLFTNGLSLGLYVVADVANFLVMASFFLDENLRRLLSNVGFPIEVKFSPWTIDSPVQWVAAVRNFSLLVLIVMELTRISRPSSLSESLRG